MADIESVSSSVVREYLSRKGLKGTLAILDKELPRTDTCISNRAHLAKELHINTLMKKNKESEAGFRTMLEVIVQFMMAKTWQRKHSGQLLMAESEGMSSTSSLREEHAQGGMESSKKTIQKSHLNTKQPQTEALRTKRDSMTEVKLDSNSKINSPEKENFNSQMAGQNSKNFEKNPSRILSEDTWGSGLMDKPGGSSGERIKMEGNRSGVKEDQLSSNKNESLHIITTAVGKQLNPESRDDQRPSEQTHQRKDLLQLGGKKATLLNEPSSIKSSNQKQSSRRNVRNKSSGVVSTGLRPRNNEGTARQPRYLEEDLKESPDVQRRRSEDFSTGERMKEKQEPFLGNSERKRNAKDLGFVEKPSYFMEHYAERRPRSEKMTLPVDDKLSKLQKPFSTNQKLDNHEVADWKKEIVEKKEMRQYSRKSPRSSQFKATKKDSTDELIFEDIDDNLDDELHHLKLNTSSRKSSKPLPHHEPITLKQAKDLKTVVFGSPVGCFNSEWRNQGFSFCRFDHLKYGIVQRKGGPCGLLASVQAVVLKHLLFNDRLSPSISKQRLHFTFQETTDALCSALVEILWRAGSWKAARVALRSEKDQFIPSGGYKADKLTEKLVIYEFNDRSELETFIKENINQFSSDDAGSILLLYSVILSRTAEKINKDMDDENGTLMGAHGYCTQDMVNLLITGKAISNTFDDVIELDSGGETKNILKGIEKQSDIGLLSLFEHYKSCLVGANLKSPKFPIWVVCSESHFSVLFSSKRSLVNERRSQKKFDLYYYDGLAGQTEEIRLTVDTSRESFIEDTRDDLTPPLEHCIRTKWKDAVIDWNGTEPLL